MSRLPDNLLHRLLRILSTAITLIFVMQVCVSTVSARNPVKLPKPRPDPAVTSTQVSTSTSIQSEWTGMTETIASDEVTTGVTETQVNEAGFPTTAADPTDGTVPTVGDQTTQTLEPEPGAGPETIAETTNQTVSLATTASPSQATTGLPAASSTAATVQTIQTTIPSTSQTLTPTQNETQATTGDQPSESSPQTTTTESITRETTLATTESTVATSETTATSADTTNNLEIYVAPDGRDSGSGSASAPYRTIQYAIDRAVSGTTIRVRAGTYCEKLTITGKTDLSVVNAPDDRPILTGTGFTGGYLVSISSSNGILFNGFELKDFKAPDFEVIYIKNGSSNVEISDCKIHDIAVTQADGNAHAILAKSTTDTTMRNITIRNNRIYNCKTGYSEAVTVQGNVEGFVVSRNVIHDNTNIGIDIAGFYNNDCSDPKLNQARKGVVSGNLIYNLYCAYATCAGIYVDGGRDTIIENNTIYNTMYGIEIGCENAVDKVHTAYQATVSGIVVRNNLVYNNTKAGLTNGGYEGLETGKVIGTKIYGNTFYNNVVEIELSYCDDIMIEKNIIDNSGNSRYFIYSDMPGLATRIRLDNNLYFRQDGSSKFKFNGQYAASLSEWQSKFSQDAGSRYADPMFANPADGDFTLQDKSPAIGFIR